MGDLGLPHPKAADAGRVARTVQTLQGGDLWQERFAAFAQQHGWATGTVNPVLLVPWSGAPFRVKGELIWPGASTGTTSQGVRAFLGQAARWTPGLAGSGTAMHPTWNGSTVVFAVVADPLLADRGPFSLLRRDRLPIGSRLLARTGLRKLNHGLPLGDTKEEKLGAAVAKGLGDVLVLASNGSDVGRVLEAGEREPWRQLRGHIRFQHGVLVAWDWYDHRRAGWMDDAVAAVSALTALHQVVVGRGRARGSTGRRPPPDFLRRDDPLPATSGDRELTATLRFHQRRRRDPTTGSWQVLGQPSLRLPEGCDGTVTQWLVEPRDVLRRGQAVAVVRRDDGASVRLLCPRAGHTVVRRRALGSEVHHRTVMVSVR